MLLYIFFQLFCPLITFFLQFMLYEGITGDFDNSIFVLVRHIIPKQKLLIKIIK